MWNYKGVDVYDKLSAWSKLCLSLLVEKKFIVSCKSIIFVYVCMYVCNVKYQRFLSVYMLDLDHFCVFISYKIVQYCK